jgi:NAD(P)-dependent dehydrogenase (short-subunit alcohol dehydrogenase family)
MTTATALIVGASRGIGLELTRCTLAGLTPADNGRFLNHDGQPLAW